MDLQECLLNSQHVLHDPKSHVQNLLILEIAFVQQLQKLLVAKVVKTASATDCINGLHFNVFLFSHFNPTSNIDIWL